MLDAALTEYKKKTGSDLLAHWLTAELQTCESVDAVLDILRDQAKAFEKSGDQRLMKWIDPLVHVLHMFSGTLGDGVGLVLISDSIHDIDHSSVIFQGISSCKSNLYWNWCSPRRPCSAIPLRGPL